MREFAQALGGDVSVTSTVGEGSTFTVRIPVGSARESSRRRETSAARPTQAALRPSCRRPRAGSSLAQVAGALPSPPEPSGPRPRVLVVEDNADMRRYLAQVLSRDYEVQTVGDGAAALESATAAPPDLVLSDVLMPRMDGLALVRALHSTLNTRSVPAILLTARAGEEAALEGLGSGADDYVVKPFSSRELRARVHTHLVLARMRAEAAESAMKDRFMGIASHELRTPLMTMKLQLELLARDVAAVLSSTGGASRPSAAASRAWRV